MKSSLSDGIIVFQVPSVDLTGLAQRGAKIDPWPERAGQLFDGNVPPLMQLLLMGDSEGSEFMEQLPKSGKLSNFDVDDNEHRQTILQLAAASRRLLSQLANGGQQEIQKRLQTQPDSNDRFAVEQIMRGVPPDLFRQAYRDWFENKPDRDIASNSLRVSVNSASDSRLDNSLLIDDSLTSNASSSNLTPLSSKDEVHATTWKPLKAAKHLEAGGWMIDSQRLAIVYIPEGHADPWLTALLTYSNQLPRSPRTDELSQSLLANNGAGRCLECHQSVGTQSRLSNLRVKTVSMRTEPNYDINHLWRADRFDARIRQLTRFDHGPHLILPSLTDCVACHRMASLESGESNLAQRDFQSMSIQDCASCHQSKAAGDRCTQCHNYHTNSIEHE